MPLRAKTLLVATAACATLVLPGVAQAAPAPWFVASIGYRGLLAPRGAVLGPCGPQNDGEVVRIVIRTPDGDVSIWEMECDGATGSWVRRSAPAMRPVRWPQPGWRALRPMAA